jgi:protein SCO1/2
MKNVTVVAFVLLISMMTLGCGGEDPPAGQAAISPTKTVAEPPKSVRVMNTLPDFRLQSQEGEPFGSDELKGNVWIATFIFTRCVQTCPLQTAELVHIQNKLKDHEAADQIHFVSISVDPAHDTEEILKGYAFTAGSDLSRWTYLTGKREDIWSLSKDGFKLPVTDVDADPQALIAHSQSFVLVDRAMRVRGHYDGLNKAARARLLRDLEVVLLDPPASDTGL